jgi:hypothetical protein
VEKGILTPGEAQQIITETQEEVKKEIAKGTNTTLPMWLQTFKLKGDLRLRYEYSERDGNTQGRVTDNGQTIDRQRGRFRLRVGAESKVNDQAKVYFGLASGSDGDPRSTNQTFQDSFAKKSVWIDYAYVDYTPLKWLELIGGRMKNPIWEPGDMMWDTDINPEGGVIKLSRQFNPNLSAYLTGAAFVLDEYAATGEPSMYAFQPGLDWKINDRLNLKLATTYYGFQNIQNSVLDWSAASNSRKTAAVSNGISGLLYDYDVISPAMELAIVDPLKSINQATGLNLDIPWAALFFEYVNNLRAAQSEAGWMAGLKIGHEKIAGWKQWQFKYNFTNLGTNSWLDIFPDSDRYSGQTGIHGHEWAFSLGLSKNTSLDIDYYLVNKGNQKHNTDHLLQVDFNFKF